MGLSWIADDAQPRTGHPPASRRPGPGRHGAARRPAPARPRGLAAAAAWLSEAAGSHLSAGYGPGGPARRSFRRYWL